MGEQIITPEWLAAHGWRAEHREDLPGSFCREVGGELLGGRPFLGASDDLCIVVAPRSESDWFVWVWQQEPRRHIHVRAMRETWELVSLWEGLTGREWPKEGEAVADRDLPVRRVRATFGGTVVRPVYPIDETDD